MESNNAPAHDFAPAWLKLPAPVVNTKSTNKDTNDKLVDQQRRLSRSKEFNSATNNSISDIQQQQQQRSNYNNHESSHYLNSRHYSLSGEQQYNVNGHSVANDINGTRFNKNKYIDQRSSYRREYREKSTASHHSNTKLSNRNNAELKSVYSTSKKVTNEKLDYRDNNQSRKKLTANEENRNIFNQEFPSLIDDVNTKNGSNSIDNLIVNSAWSNTAAKSKVLSTSKHKVQLIQRSVSNFDNIDGFVKTETNHIINNSKLVITTPIARNNMSIIGKAKTGVVKENSIYSNVFGQTTKILPVFARTSIQTTTPAMEILVKNPKMRGNKSHFLKSIRNNESKDKDLLPLDNEMINKLKKNVDSENETESNQSSFDISEMEAKRRNSDPISFEVNTSNDHFNDSLYNHDEEIDGNLDGSNHLSSSLEAEHRFLLELGWKQDDDPAYAPLTEDEVREFKDLINARNGYKRHNAIINNQITHLNLSPKKTLPLTLTGRPNDRINNFDDDTTSSSEDDD